MTIWLRKWIIDYNLQSEQNGEDGKYKHHYISGEYEKRK